MTYDLILCECVCGRRIGYPADPDTQVTGFVCDSCFLRYRFQSGAEPIPVELTDGQGRAYRLGFWVFSLKRETQEFAEEIVGSWFRQQTLPVEADSAPVQGFPDPRVSEASG